MTVLGQDLTYDRVVTHVNVSMLYVLALMRAPCTEYFLCVNGHVGSHVTVKHQHKLGMCIGGFEKCVVDVACLAVVGNARSLGPRRVTNPDIAA